MAAKLTDEKNNLLMVSYLTFITIYQEPDLFFEGQ